MKTLIAALVVASTIAFAPSPASAETWPPRSDLIGKPALTCKPIYGAIVRNRGWIGVSNGVPCPATTGRKVAFSRR